jgi:hypothetical protein
MDSKALWKRYSTALKRRDSSWYSHFYECYRYTVPQREALFEYTKGQKKNTHLHDNTAMQAVQIYANRVQQTVVPPGQKWITVVAGDNIDKEAMVDYQGEQLKVSEALDRLADTVFNYIHRSNFDQRVNEACVDLAISTGAMTCDYDAETDDLIFDAIPLSNIVLSSNGRGEVADVWRKSKIPLRGIQRIWAEARIPEKYAHMMESKPDEEMDIIEAVCEEDGKYTLYVMLESDKEVIYEEDFGTSSPWIVFRSQVVSGEVYGRGPVMSVLPDIKTLNVMGEYSLKSAALQVLGVWTATDDGVFNPYTFRIAPGIAIPVSSNSNDNPTLKPLATGANVQFHELEYERRRDNVNRALFAKPIGDITDPTKTATEINIRRQIDLQEAGATFGRLSVELAGATFRRAFDVLKAAGKIPDIVIDGENVRLKYLNNMARAADYEEAQIAMQALTMALNSGVPPEQVMLSLKTEDFPAYLAEKMGLDPELVRSEQEKAAIQQQQQQAMQAQAMAQMAQEQA